jgi:hypothetical protein
VRNYVAEQTGICKLQEVYMINNETFMIQGCSDQWHLSQCATFSFQLKCRKAEHLQTFTSLPLRLCSIILGFDLDAFESPINFLGEDARPHLSEMVEDKSIYDLIVRQLISIFSPIVKCEEVNSITGEFQSIPLSNLTFNLSRGYWHHFSSTQHGFCNTNRCDVPDFTIFHADDMTIWKMLISFVFIGSRDTYYFQYVPRGHLPIKNEDARLMIVEKDCKFGNPWNAVHFGGKQIVSVGGFVSKSAGKWYWDTSF